MKAAMNYLDFLLDRYGPLMTLNDVAEILKRSPQGLRVSCYRDYEFSHTLNAAKVRYGRRVYFKTDLIAKLLDSVSVEAL
jgi:hypothetical protein